MRKMRNKENVQRGKQACDAGMNKERKSEKKNNHPENFWEEWFGIKQRKERKKHDRR